MDSKQKKEERKKYIKIRHPSIISLVIQIIATVLLWCIAIYCFRDVLYSIYMLFHNVNIIRAFPVDAAVNVLFFGIVAFIIIVVWMVYNKLMFGGRERRKFSPIWTKEQIKTLYGIDDEKYISFQNGKIIDINFDEDNSIKNVHVKF